MQLKLVTMLDYDIRMSLLVSSYDSLWYKAVNNNKLL